MGEKYGKDEEKRSKRSKFIDEKGGIKVKGREASVARIRGEINESNWTGNGQQFTSSYSSSSSSSMTRKPSFTTSSGGGDRDGGGKSSNNDDLGPNLFSSMAIVAVAQTYYTPSTSIDITSSSPHPNNNGHGGSSTDVTTLPSLSKRLLLPKNRCNRIYAAPPPSPILSSNQKNPPCNELILKKMECTGESKVAGEKQRSKLTTTNTSSTSSSSWTCLELNKMNKSGNDIAIIGASPSLAFTESKMDSRIGGNKQEHGGQLPFQQPSKRKWLEVREREAKVNKTKRDIAPATTITRDLVLPSLSHFVEATVVTTTERKLIGSGRENESALDLWDYDDEDGSSGNAKTEKNNSNNKSLCRSNLLKKGNAKENGKMGGSSSVATKSGNKSTLRFSSGKKVGTVKNPITLGCKNPAVTTKTCVGADEMSNSNSNNNAIPLPNINIPVVTTTAVKEKKVSKCLDLEENGERLLPLKKCTGRNMGNILTRQTTLISSKRSNTSSPPTISYTTDIKGNNVTSPSTSGSNIGRAGSGGGASGKNSLKKESQTGSTTGEVKLERNENVKIAEKNNIPFCAHNRPRLSYPDNEKRWANSVSSQLPPSLSPLTLSPSSFSSWNNGNTRHPVKSPVSQEVKPAKIGKFRKLTRNVGSRSSSTTPAATKYDRQVSRFSFKRMAIVSPSPQLRIHSQSTYLSKKAVAFIPTTCASHAAPTPSNRGNEIVDQVKQKVSTSTLSPRVPSKCLDFLVGTGRRSCTKAEQSKLLLPSEKMDGMREELEMKVCSKNHVEHDECRRVAQNSKVEMDSKNESESSRSKKETSFDSEGVGSLDENEDDVNTILHEKTETRVEFMTDSLVDEEHDNNGRLLSNIISPPTLFISSSRDEGDANTTSFLDDDHAHFKCTFQQLPSPNLRSESCCHNFDKLPAREIGGDFEAAINKPFSSTSLAFNPTRRCANDDGVDYDDDTESNERRRPFPYSLLHTVSHDESASSHDSYWSNLAPNHLNQETPFPRERFTDNQNHHERHEENGRTVNAKVPQENDGNEMMMTRATLSDQSYHSHYHYHQHHHHYPQEPSSTRNCPLILSEPLSSSMFPFYDDDFDDSSFVPISNILSDTLIKNFPKWLQIYTDWANHYLEKARCKRQIQDLQVDVTDGVILADVIEAVTSQKVPDVHRKPKTSSQMLDNIQSCLVFLTNLGVSLEGINARDIRDGHLKSILSLFFQLSRYKQQQKQQDRDRHNNQTKQTIPDNNIIMMQQQQHHRHYSSGHSNNKSSSQGSSKNPHESSKLPGFCKQHTSIPIPNLGAPVVNGVGSASTSSSSGVVHQHHSFPQQQHHNLVNAHISSGNVHGPSKKSSSSSVDKGKGLIGGGGSAHGHPYNSSGSLNVKPTSGSSSRSTSPSAAALAGVASSGVSGIPHSFIPQPRSSSIPSAPSSARSSIHEKHLPNNAKLPSSAPTGSSSSSSKSSSRTQNNNAVNAQQHGSIITQQQHQQSISSSNKGSNSSMLEKFKFFKDKDKSDKLKGSGSSSSSSNKRTSSSSGFSSARSERSDSSVSLSSETKTGVTEGSPSSSSSGVILRNRSSGGGDRHDIVGGSNTNSKSGHGGGSAGGVAPQMLIDSSSSTPRLAIKGFRQKLGKAIASKESSPKASSHHHSSSSSPKSSRKESGDSHHHRVHSNESSSSLANNNKSGTSSSGGYHQPSSSSSQKGHGKHESSSKSSSSSSRAMTKHTGTISEALASPPSDSSLCGSAGGVNGVDNVNVTNSGQNGSSSSAPSFLRQPKGASANGSSSSRDSKNRFSGTGIPTRNSLIGGSGGGSPPNSQRDSELLTMSQSGNSPNMSANNNNNINNNIASNNNNLLEGNSVSTTSLNSTASSNMSSTTNGVLQCSGNGTGIPKPTAAVKGTTKQLPSSNPQSNGKALTDEAKLSGGSNRDNNSKQNSTRAREDVVNPVDSKNEVGLVASPPSNPSSSPLVSSTPENNEIKPEVTSCSSSDSRSNLSQNSFSSEKSLCGSSSGGGPSTLNKTSTNSSIKSTESCNNGITVALVSPMPSLTNSASNTASVSSMDSNSGLTQSQFSASSVSQSNSNSNSSDVTVMLASKYQQQLQQSAENVVNNSVASSVEQGVEQVASKQLEIRHETPDEEGMHTTATSKISPGSGFESSTASGSSSMGSLKCMVETGSSSSGTSVTSPTCVTQEQLGNGNVNQKLTSENSVPGGKSGAGNNDNRCHQENGNSVIPECDEDDLILNVKPMEPLLRNSPYGYIKSPPGGHPGSSNSPAFFAAAHKAGGNGIQMRRTGSCENGNPNNRSLVKSIDGSRHGYTNPYCDPSRVIGRRAHPPPTGSFSTSGYASSTAGDYDYADIDNFDMTTAGYLSDGDLLMSGNSTNETNRMNDGYVSESGVSIYGRRVSHVGGADVRNGSRRDGPSNRSSSHNNNSKHGVITEDSFDDSSSISSGISDLNEIPTDLTSSSVNSSPYASLQRGGVEDSKGASSSSKAPPKKLESQQSIIYRVVGSRSSGRRSTAADTSDLVGNSQGNFHKISNLPNSVIHHHHQQQQLQQRSATLPVGFVDPSRIISGKSVQKHGHLVSNLRGSESSSSLRRVASPVGSSASHQHQHHHHPHQPLLSPSGGGGVGSGVFTGDYGNSRVVSRDKHHSSTSSPHNGPRNGHGAEYSNYHQHTGSSTNISNNALASSHKKSMNSLDPKGSARKGMMGIKEDHYGKETIDKCERQQRSGAGGHTSSGSSGSSSSGGGGGSDGTKRSKGVGVGSASAGVGIGVGLQSPGAPGGFGFMRRPSAGIQGGNNIPSNSPKYAVPVTVSGKMVGMRDMMTADEFKQAHAALAAATSSCSSHMSPYSVITTIQQQQSSTPGSAQSPKARTKVKVSGGTQTTNDLHEMSRGHSATLYAQQQHQQQQHQQQHQHHPHQHHSQTLPGHGHGSSSNAGEVSEYASSTCSRNSGSFASSSHQQPGGGGSSSSAAGYKSLSLTTPTAAQLSQSLRERILGSQSLPKGATSSADYAAILAAIQHQQQHQQIYGTPNSSRDRMARYAAASASNGGTKNMMNDGSLSDAGGYAAYSEIYASTAGVSGSTPYSWMRHSTGYASSITSAPNRLIGVGGSMTEAESMESLSSTSSLAAQLRDARSNSLTQGRLSSAQPNREQGSPSRSPRLNRSNSISHFRERTFPRSTKSEKLYPSMLQRNEDANPYYSSTMSATGVPTLPTSPIHGPTARLCGGPSGAPPGPYSSAASASSNHSVRLSMSPYTGFLAKLSTKEDDINASSLSLVSTASSLYSSQEDKHAHEVRKMRRELQEAQEKVQTLTNQLTTNAHVVAAFEQSLSSMTRRLETLTLTAEQKDSELTELKTTIELLRKQSVEAGLTVPEMAGVGTHDESPMARQLSADSVSSINSISSACSGTSHSHTSSPSGQVQMTPSGTPTHSANLITPESPGSKKKHAKGKGWLRSSFTKAFSRSKSKTRNDSSPDHADMIIDHDGQLRPNHFNGDVNGTHHQHRMNNATHLGPTSQHHQSINAQHRNPHLLHHQQQHQLSHNGGLKGVGNSMPTSPLLSPPPGEGRKNNSSCSISTGSHSPRSNGGGAVSHDGRSRLGSATGLCEEPPEEPRSVDELKKQLREKEMVLTDIRLEALTSAHQLESLKETVTKMRNEMLSLKQDNERLQRMVTCKSLTSSQTSLQMGATEGIDRRLSASEVPPPSSATLEMFLTDSTEKEGKRITVSVYLGSHGCYDRYISPIEGIPAQECIIGTISVSTKTKWDALDSLVKRAFKDYLMRIDPVSSLGLSADSVVCYAVGEVVRSKEGTPPELLPCGYLVGDVTKIRICLRGALQGAVDALAFETCVPKSVLQRYMALLGDNGRIIICGPSGTGKSYLARKLGEFLVARSGKDPCPEAIASFSADHKNSKELRQYLINLVEQCDGSGGIDLPSVIILDNLHQVANLGDVFNGVLSSRQQASPIIVGTMTQSASAPPNVQLHHNFRWVLFGNHMEPVKGLLSRFLQRRLIEVDTQNGTKNLELARVVDWIPKVWHHVNKVLEAHNSADVTIGPRLFLSCPMDVANSQVWFTDLWHYSVVPYLIEAVKEGLQIFGKKAMWEDPSQYLILTYPWPQQLALNTGKSSLQRIRPEDVGYDIKAAGNGVGSNGNKATHGDISNDTDPLMNMLMRLQEAANYSGPQSNDSDTTSLDSHVSLDPKDYIATV